MINTGLQLDGKKAATAKAEYFKNYRFVSCLDVDGQPMAAIPDRNTKFLMRCSVHSHVFLTTTRALFNTSQRLKTVTCPFCQRAAGQLTFTTLGELANQMAADADFDWVLDSDALLGGRQDRDRILATAECLPLVCKRNKWNSPEPCNARREHSVDNIQTALRRRKRYIVCQGECDSSPKLKWSRLPFEELERRLADTRAGEWVLSRPDAYRKMSEEQWFTHVPCGNEVYRVPWQILADRGKSEDVDCPYCTKRSVLACVAGSVAHFARWVEVATDGKVQYVESRFPDSNDTHVGFLCRCGNPFREKPANLTRYEHYGCTACRAVSLKAQRAWVLEEAQEIVGRRRYKLLNDPKSYTDDAELIAPDGTRSPCSTILNLVRSLPARAHGFGARLHSGAPTAVGSKRRFHVNDAAFAALTPTACFWAGLLAADATITDDAEIVLELKTIDEIVLQGLAQFVQFTGSFGYRTVKSVAGRGIYCSLRFLSSQICADLKRTFGIVPRKTRVLPCPNLSDPVLERAYMAGLFEGDGHVRRTRRGLVMHFVSASYGNFKWFVDCANAITGTKAKPRILEKARGPIYNVTYQDAAAEKLMCVLRKAGPGLMKRKWQLG